jgi:REP-associated tyrosine transposase
MTNYRRPRLAGATVFFTVNLALRGSDQLVREIASLRAAFSQTQRNHRWSIDAIVILPDHLHAVVTLPDGDHDYSTRWRLIKSRFSRQVSKGRLRPSHIARSERGVWQRRFWEHHIRDETEYQAAIRYCWYNPVKHDLVEQPTDWPYSSIHRDTVGCVQSTRHRCVQSTHPTPVAPSLI